MRKYVVVASSLLVLALLVVSMSAQQRGPAVAPQVVNVFTYHNNNQRTGLNPLETILTPANVNAQNFGLLNVLPADGMVDAEPLYVFHLLINGQVHNVVYLVTEHDSIYAYDADNGTLLWKTTALLAGETSSDALNCDGPSPEIGITATPVIDLSKGIHGAMYLVAMSKDGNEGYHQRLHSIDLVTGAEMLGGPTEIQAKYPGTGDDSQDGYDIFDPKQYFARTGLLQLNGSIYFGFASHCDYRPYTGWVMRYNASTLNQYSVINVTPNGDSGGIWQSGSGLTADSDGYIYLLDGNGTFDTVLNVKGFPAFGDFGNGFLKIAPQDQSILHGMKIADFFEPYNTVDESDNDVDLGAGGPVVVDVADGHGTGMSHLVVGAGKDANIYVVDRTNMGKWNPNSNNVYQVVMNASPYGFWSTPSFFNNTLYYGGVADNIKAWPFVLGRLAAQPSSQTANIYGFPGVTTSISANQQSNGIVWALERPIPNTNPAVLHAFNAADLSQELYNSNQAGSRDQFGLAAKFVTPMIANGKVYVGAQTGVAVFGLLQ